MMPFGDDAIRAYGQACKAFPGPEYTLLRGSWVEGAGLYTDPDGTRWYASWDTRSGITYLERAPRPSLVTLLVWAAVGWAVSSALMLGYLFLFR
jgi:hypothetical protein